MNAQTFPNQSSFYDYIETHKIHLYNAENTTELRFKQTDRMAGVAYFRHDNTVMVWWS